MQYKINVVNNPHDLTIISACDRGFMLGDGVFDTICVEQHMPLNLNAHLRRLRKGALTIGIDSQINAINIKDKLKKCPPNGVLRITISRGAGQRGLLPNTCQPTITMLFFEGLPEKNLPLKVIISKFTRRNEFSPLSRIKSLSNLDAVLAAINAKKHNADEALLLNSRDNFSCATAGNIIYQLHNDAVIYTPPIADGALAGITLQKMIYRDNISRRSLHVNEINNVKHLWISNSIRGVCLVTLL